MRTRTRRRVLLLMTALTGLVSAVPAPSLATAAGTTTTPYIEAPGTSPIVDTIQDSASVAAPWNSAQGITNFDSLSITPYSTSDLLPTFSFGSSTTGTSTNGAPIEPNLAVYPAQTGDEPFPSGFAGSPGPLSGYCGASYSDSWDTSSTAATINGGLTPLNQPAGTRLPFAPYYFPYVVRNSDGSLTGYFDWRPKDADEAIVSATSTDNGKTWTATGEALEQNAGYCPSEDTNDDGEGHPYVATLGSTADLYTLARAAGDNAGIGLLEHSLASASDASPLSGVPAKESVGADPNTFATASTAVSSTPASIPVSTLGGDGSNAGVNSSSLTDSSGTSLTIPDANAIAAGRFIDVTAEAAQSLGPAAATVTCTGTSGSTGSSPTLTGCSAATPLTISSGDDLVQVIGTASAAVTIPYSNNASKGANVAQSGGATISLTNASTNSPTTLYLLNNNAPNRFYVDGSTVYCAQANADPTTKIEDCTTTDPNGMSVASGDSVIADPIDPANAGGGGVTQTSGLLSPDGIDGALPASVNSAWGAPNDAKVVLYTEKLLNYYNVGAVNGTISAANAAATATSTVDLPGSNPTDYNISPFPDEEEQLPTSGSFDVYVVPNAPTNGTSTTFVTLTCTGWNVDTNAANPDRYTSVSNTIDLIGCTGGSASQTIAAGHQGQWIAGPGAAIEPYRVLSQTGEGKSNQEKLLGNNEDYEVIRAAYTTDGVNFTDLGAISGSDNGANSTDGAYNDITDPSQQYSPAGPTGTSLDANNPQGVSPTNGTVGSDDEVELRWPGARGTIVDNPDGSIGLFLSGAWGSDGDSDAFNQIFYTQSLDGGKTWSVPRIVQSTDYSFSASEAQDANPTSALGVSAYYSGRVYDPTVVTNPDGTLTMVFSGYRLPNPVKPAGNPVGTNSSALYCEGIVSSGCETSATPDVTQTDPAIYRNILTETLWPNIGTLEAPTVTTAGSTSITTSTASLAGSVQTNEPDTAVAIDYGTSPTQLTQSVSAGTLAGASATQNVSASLSGLSQGTTYYYAVQATNESGIGTGTLASFTTSGTGATTTTTGTTTQTVTTPGPTTTVTEPGSIFTVTTRSPSTPTGRPSNTSTAAEFTASTASIGDQSVTVVVPSSTVCLVSPAELKVDYQATTINGSRKTKLSFVHATLSINGKLRATARRTSESFKLSLRGLKKGTHTLTIVTTYHHRVGRRIETMRKTQNVKFKVC